MHLTCVVEFSPEDLLDALSPVLDMLYDQFPDCLPFRQPVDPVLLQIPVSVDDGCFVFIVYEIACSLSLFLQK